MRRFTLRFVAALLLAAAVASAAAAARAQDPPETGFERSGGARWTTHQEEVDFLRAVAAASPRVALTEVGRSEHGRPLHMVALGDPVPATAVEARQRPTAIFDCTQHGNEPAGREACLRWIRDLAFTSDPLLVDQLQNQTVLFIPTMNPDGRVHNTRGNASGYDINRDHLNLTTAEARASAAVVRDWEPDVAVDLHEYSGKPVTYDAELTYLWPRNLNVDPSVRALARELAEQYIAEGARANGQRAGVYGRDGVLDYHVIQNAGDGDEEIARNAFGLRHAAAVLVETRVDRDPRTSLGEVVDFRALQIRRVDTHMRAVADTLRFMRERGSVVHAAASAAAANDTEWGRTRSRPIYFNGQDEDGTLAGNAGATPTVVADPPPCAYHVGETDLQRVSTALGLHGIATEPQPGGGAVVSLAQPARPVIALLLDARGIRHAANGVPVESCP